jgi:hypothetical protein
VTGGIVKPSEILSKLAVEAQTAGLSNKLQRLTAPAGTPDAKVRVGYVMAFDPATWTVTAMVGDSITQITGIPALAGFQPMIQQAGLFLQAGGDGTTQYTLIGMLGQGSTGGGAVRVRKAADQSVTNTATLGADSELAFYAQSERSYIFEAQLFVRQNSTVATLDLNVGWLLPAGATYTIGGSGPDTSIAGGNASLASASGQYRAGLAAVSGDKLAFGVEPATTGGTYDFHIVSVWVAGCITMGATSGLCSVGWCQNIGAAASTQVRAGSWLKVDATNELLP